MSAAEVADIADAAAHDAEAAVLGAILLSNEALDEIAGTLRPEHFASRRRRLVYEAMTAIAQRGEPIDVVTLSAELRASGLLADAGGVEAIVTLDASVPSFSAIGRYAAIVRDRATERRMAALASEIAQLSRDHSTPVSERSDRVASMALELSQDKPGAHAVVTIGDSLRRVFTMLERRHESGTEITGTATGIDDLDRQTTGLHGGELIILAARPSMGKTALALNIAARVAVTDRKPVAVFSLEMPEDDLTQRLLGREARVDGQTIRTGRFSGADWPKLARAADTIFKSPIVVQDVASPTVLDVRARARRIKAKLGGLSLVVVDYMQLMRGTSGESREQDVAEFSRGLKALARELDVPVIALSQLNRAVEKREDKRPQMSDLRESGAIEQDADVILFLYRDEVYNKESKDRGTAEIIVSKQRNGPIGTVRVAFQKEYGRFENLARDRDSAVEWA